MAESNFSKLMNACLESKKTASKKKAIKESKSKSLVEKKNAKRFVKESEDEEIEDDDLEMTVADDIVVAVDPELDADEMTAVAMGYQEIIDDTAEGEEPETDKYIGDNLYGCPLCGQTFFSEIPMGEGDLCPLCNEESPDGFVKVGEVESGESSKVDEKEDEEDFDFDGEEISVDFDDDEVDLEIDEEEDEDKEKKENKSVRRSAVRRETRKPLRRTIRGERAIAHRPVRRSVRGERAIARRTSRPVIRGERRVARRPVVRGERAIARNTRTSLRSESRIARRAMRNSVRENLNLDEKTFNKFLTKFIRENYNGTKSFEVVGAKRNGNILKLECKIVMTDGKTKKTVLNCNFNGQSGIMRARDNGLFKAESKKSPFMFKVKRTGNVITCEGMKYDFVTRRGTKNESKTYQVCGTYLNESVRPTTESKRIARRPSTRRMAESRSRLSKKEAIERRNSKRSYKKEV